MTVFLDTNLILDILLKNKDLYEESKNVLTLQESNNIDFFISAASATDIYYVLNKRLKDSALTKQYILNLLDVVSIAGVDETCIRNAINSSWNDFEDSVQHEISLQIQADYIVTRNLSDISASFVPAISPGNFIKLFQSK